MVQKLVDIPDLTKGVQQKGREPEIRPKPLSPNPKPVPSRSYSNTDPVAGTQTPNPKRKPSCLGSRV